MDSIWDLGLEVIRAIQTVECKPLTWLALFFHYAFNVPIYLAIMAYLFWCRDKKAGFFASCSLIFCSFINDFIKNILQAPRPYIRDPSVSMGVTESSYSTPSGHSASSASFFPVVSSVHPTWKRVWRILLAVLLPILVALSRLYLGVHYPTDVLAGLMLGYIVSIGVIMFGEKISRLISKLRPSLILLIVALICFGANAITMANVAMSGLLMGLCGGEILVNQKGGFDPADGSKKQKILRFLLGLAIVGGVYLVGSLLSPAKDNSYYHMIRFIRYGLCGFTGTFLCPLLFIKLKLGSPAKEI